MPLASLIVQLAVVAGLLATARPPLPPGAGVPDPTEGPIRAWVLHAERELGERAATAYADLVEAMPADVELVIACGAGVDGTGLCAALGLGGPGGRPVTLLEESERLSPWARDRYLAFPIGDTTRVLLPRPDSVASSNAGDCDVARQLADWDPELELVESRLAIEGGDVLVSGAVVLVGATTILANADRFEEGPAGVEARLEELFDREVVVVGGREGAVPHEHLDMYVSFVGGRRLLLGDPRLTRRLFDRPDELENSSLEARSIGVFSWQTQAEAATLYDELAGLLEDAGFLVQRLPILHTDDGDLVTWNNAVTERRGTRGTAYVPSYGFPSLDDLARRTWTQAGYEVKSVRCAQVIGEGGAVRCLTNVLRDRPVRGQSPPVGR